MEIVDIGRLLAAVAAGAVIGFEREIHEKPAGLRTNIMVCLGAAFFTLLSERLALAVTPPADPTRIAAQIVTGVGFLGAGAIIQFRANVVGLTTAATIWAVASVGMAFGAGYFALGATVTVLIAVVLVGLSFAEHAIPHWRRGVHLEIDVLPDFEIVDALEKQARASGLQCPSWFVTKGNEYLTIHVELLGSTRTIDQLLRKWMPDERIRALRRS